MILGSNSVNALNYLYHLIIGRLLGPASYGELAALISVVGLLGMIPGSINLVIIKYISAAKTEDKLVNLINWLKRRVLKGALLSALVILIISPLISSFLHIDNLIYLVLIAVFFPFSILALLNRAVLQGLLRFKEMILSLLIESGIKLVLSIVLVYLGYMVGGAMLALAIAGISGWFITRLYLNYPNKKETDILPEIKSMIAYSFPVLVYTIAATSLYSSDLILVKHFFTSHDAGLYASLSTLGKIIFFGTGPIGSVMFPIISQRYARGIGYEKVFIYSFLATLTISLAILSVYLLVPELAISMLYGSAFRESADLLAWFGLFITLFTLSSLLINFNLSLGRTKVVVLPFFAAIAQITIIWFNHQNLLEVISISILVTALLLVSLLIYSIYAHRKFNRNKTGITNSSSL